MRKFISLYILFAFISSYSFAQEELLDLQIDGELSNFYQQNKQRFKNSKLEEPMFLPFFDNFNQASYRPDESLWIGENVYVNKKFQFFPADLGVATFDAMDGEGQIHSNASPFAFAADTLTSQPIRLDSLMDPTLRPVLIKDSIYLSFYYQPQGSGNAPEEQDKLTLEFYSPSLDQWYEMWSSDGMKLDSFLIPSTDTVYMKQVLIAVNDSAKFYHSGFQFRFHNMASLAGSSQPDWQANCDHWNLDFVWLNKNRSIIDSSYRKIAFVNNPPAMIKRYQQMPYRQYRNDPTNSMREVIDSMSISNLDSISYTAVYSYHVSNQSSQDSVYDAGSTTVFPYSESGYVKSTSFKKPPVDFFFSIYPTVQETYTVRHVVNDIGVTGIGDTAYRQQIFSNFYAYDDGTPEVGYGLQESGSKAVVQYQLNTKDTLTRVQMYFNPTLTSANENYFYILVYKSIDPEELLYKKRFKVQFTDGMYKFHTFDLDTNLVLANEFYLGFEQITDDNLNIGYDYSLDAREYMFYNIGVGWNQSIYSGSLMMRPEFGVNELTGIETIKPEKESFSFYPNPVNGSYITIEYSGSNQNNVEMEVFNLMGQLIHKERLNTQMDVSQFNSGVYLLRLIDKTQAQVLTKKMIIR